MELRLRQYKSCDADPLTAFDESGVVGHLILRYTDVEKKAIGQEN